MNVRLTNSEKEVMELLWEKDEPLTSSEIVKLSVQKKWKPSYIHIMIKSLLDKGLIVVHDFKKTTKNYARTFSPTLSRDQWIADSVRNNYSSTKDILLLFKTIIEKEENLDILDSYAELLEKRKRRLRSLNH